MPDLTIHAARWCIENEFYHATVEGSNGETYSIEYGKHVPGEYGANWSCTCNGFKFRKTCKHVDAEALKKCDYGWEAAAGSPTEMGKVCPECGGATAIMEFAA
jgi:hypothetical protein